MNTETVHLTDTFPVSPQVLFDAWLDSARHSAMTGGIAVIDPTTFGRYSSRGGDVEGLTLEVECAYRIVQTWRSSEFPSNVPDSRLELHFEPYNRGTRLTVLHTDIPRGHAHRCEQVWRDHYLAPMHAYFGAHGAKAARGRAGKTRAVASKARASTAKKAVSKKSSSKKTPRKKTVGKSKAGAKSSARASKVRRGSSTKKAGRRVEAAASKRNGATKKSKKGARKGVGKSSRARR